MRGATSSPYSSQSRSRYFNPRAPCGARLSPHGGCVWKNTISIHAPRAGRDPSPPPRWRICWHFNPRAPCGARLAMICSLDISREFQSTRPVRGATNETHCWHFDHAHFNPRAPCGARPVTTATLAYLLAFQSTRPVRGATVWHSSTGRMSRISIHAPRAGRDESLRPMWTWVTDFNPRAPCGARRFTKNSNFGGQPFQSTRPVRGATTQGVTTFSDDGISIHAPRAGRDLERMLTLIPKKISIHAPRAGRDPTRAVRCCIPCYFNPRAPCGARHSVSGLNGFATEFQSTRPVRGATV